MAGGGLPASVPASPIASFWIFRTSHPVLPPAQRQWFITLLCPFQLRLASVRAHREQPCASQRAGGPKGAAASTPPKQFSPLRGCPSGTGNALPPFYRQTKLNKLTHLIWDAVCTLLHKASALQTALIGTTPPEEYNRRRKNIHPRGLSPRGQLFHLAMRCLILQGLSAISGLGNRGRH